MIRVTENDIALAKATDLTEVAKALGYTVKKIGRYYTIKEMDSIRIYDRNNWYRFSRPYEKGSNGGTQIDFLEVFAGLDFPHAVEWLVNFQGKTVSHIETQKPEKEPEKRKTFKLPAKAYSYKRMYAYLIKERGLSARTVDFFVRNNLIYEDAQHHNIVFLGRDAEGKVRFASLRGTSDWTGHKFKCDVTGNDKNYGFNITGKYSDEVIVFEGAIDLMSYCDMMNDYETNMIALGMLHDAPLERFLEEHPDITSIKFCLDNDEPGRAATEQLMKKYYEKGYEVEDYHVPFAFKDCNDLICGKEMNRTDYKNDLEESVICVSEEEKCRKR